MPRNYKKYKCGICGKEISTAQGLFQKHIEKEHNLDFIEYLREYHPELGGYCKNCGKPTKFIKLCHGFRDYCCNSCAQSSPEVQERIKQVWLEKYGVDNPMKNPECVAKLNEKLAPQRTEIARKGREAWYAKPEEERERIIRQRMETLEQNTGYENIFKNPEFIARNTRNLKLKRYDSIKRIFEERWNTILLDSPEEYADNTIHNFKCKLHGIEFQHEFYPGLICPECKKESSSTGELALYTWLTTELGLEVQWKEGTRKILPNHQEIDLFIPSLNIGIEYDGIWFHSALYGKSPRYHLDKTKEAENLGIQLIHVFENEWLDKQDIVKSILRAKLGKIENRYYARECEILIPSNQEYYDFLEENHIQGYVCASEKYGLYHTGKLVCIASFTKSRFKKGEWELVRFCNKKDCTVVGGMSKLMKYWRKVHPGSTLYSYCDRRYSIGTGYEASGWKKIAETRPQYHYFKKNTRILENRMKYQKKCLEKMFEDYDDSKTELEIMKEHGYNWIWDCGTLKMIYEG